MVVSDRGGEFRNRLMKRINHVFMVNRIVTTPYNPRTNGLVGNHKNTQETGVLLCGAETEGLGLKYLLTYMLMLLRYNAESG